MGETEILNGSNETQYSNSGTRYERRQWDSAVKSLIKEQQWVAVIDYLTTATDSFKDDFPICILHVACSIPTIPVNVVHAIVKAYPDACLKEDEDGSLPIHIACSTIGISLQVIEFLMITCPASCMQKDNTNGEIPIYLFFYKNDSADIGIILGRLIMSLPASSIYNNTTSLIHEAGKRMLPETTINQIIETHPQVCQVRNINGDTILHILCSYSNLTPRTISIIVKLYPNACAKLDNDGNLPLHRINSGIHLQSAVQMILTEHPYGVLKRNMYGSIPLETQCIRELFAKIKPIPGYSDSEIVRCLQLTTHYINLVSIQDSYYEMQCDLTCCYFTYYSQNAPFLLPAKFDFKLEIQIKSLFHLTTKYVYGCAGAMHLGSRLTVAHHLFFWTRFPLFTRMLLKQSPYVTKKEDKHGELPLHVIAKHNFGMHRIYECSTCSSVPIAGPFLWYSDGIQVCAKCNNSKSTDRFWNSSLKRLPLLEYPVHEILKDIVSVYPQAASIPDRFGKFPLHLSLYAGSTWDTGVKEIFEAAPNLIFVQDSSGLLPFMIAAYKKTPICNDQHTIVMLNDEQIENKAQFQKKVDLLELTTVFKLLLNSPSQVIRL